MKFGVVVFPGSNCDMDMVYVIETIMKQEVVKLWHKDTDLQNCDFIILPGGFSYGDYLRSGSIANYSPIMEKVVEHSNKGGYVMGICNGFQILCESGLLPGALLHNTNHKFICKNIHLKPISKNTLVTNQYSDEAIKIPIAHGEGRFYADENTLNKLIENDQILFKYSDEKGNITKEANPNGSILNIAGICNNNRNVFGMMPHPERAADTELNNTDGKILFDSILNEVLS
ncbi:MAG: phosphoribosylformylglycinamidine synthase subunit PurQ [Flavobacteriales bacterium]|jgi:phosphoribosylformylglycinamidine synthase subunit PurQ / glutaminase|nr:phosphoribosylformylglycinamidine synthase subunit PurQ [Flavobacteriales bacterium]MBT4738345.1 phosphoribosylformylglycinamidine synthase subunit PurQ [Flavobacteriales bacterium]MBT5354617.1 phosphoribosylformylglycinamidine synthase subunit PurQ [Flavobacteriales bacterium]MBT5699163.1 phosphoribosylformylglycinamidine synthase subunit PurQ [Flavobacteriales bacterium]MBT6699565.1 phosphoribosylformylglycinamidine synthase subunit PurQ [Flavobacteriales bacterium]